MPRAAITHFTPCADHPGSASRGGGDGVSAFERLFRCAPCRENTRQAMIAAALKMPVKPRQRPWRYEMVYHELGQPSLFWDDQRKKYVARPIPPDKQLLYASQSWHNAWDRWVLDCENSTHRCGDFTEPIYGYYDYDSEKRCYVLWYRRGETATRA